MFEDFIRPKYAAFDDGILTEVVIENCYKLPDKLEGVVIDIGAHIGFFSAMALERGAMKVLAFEPDPGTYVELVRNLKPYGDRACCFNLALWSSPAILTYQMDPVSGIGCCAGENNGMAVFGDILDNYIKGSVEFLKIDCEGAEFPILYASKKLWAVRQLAIETHPITLRDGLTYSNDTLELVKYLEGLGFKCTARKNGKEWYYIYGKR